MKKDNSMKKDFLDMDFLNMCVVLKRVRKIFTEDLDMITSKVFISETHDVYNRPVSTLIISVDVRGTGNINHMAICWFKYHKDTDDHVIGYLPYNPAVNACAGEPIYSDTELLLYIQRVLAMNRTYIVVKDRRTQ